MYHHYVFVLILKNTSILLLTHHTAKVDQVVLLVVVLHRRLLPLEAVPATALAVEALAPSRAAHLPRAVHLPRALRLPRAVRLPRGWRMEGRGHRRNFPRGTALAIAAGRAVVRVGARSGRRYCGSAPP